MWADPATTAAHGSAQALTCDKADASDDWTKTQGLMVQPDHPMFCALTHLALEKPKDEPTYLQAFLATGHMCRTLRATRNLEINEPLATFVQEGVYAGSKDGPLKDIEVTETQYRLAIGYGWETTPITGDPMLYRRVISGEAKTGGGYTCCGMRAATGLEKALAWLGALGGFAGLLRTLLFFIPPRDHTETENCLTRCCLVKLPRQQRPGGGGDVVMHANPMERLRSATEISQLSTT